MPPGHVPIYFCVRRMIMTKLKIAIIAVVSYVVSFVILIICLSNGMELPSSVQTVVNIIYLPLLLLMNLILGGRC